MRPRTIGRSPQESSGAQDLQDAADALAQSIPQFWWTQGSLVELTFTASTLDQTVPHKLAGEVRGFTLCDLVGTGAVTINRGAVGDSRLAKSHIRLIASAACTAKVWAWR